MTANILKIFVLSFIFISCSAQHGPYNDLSEGKYKSGKGKSYGFRSHKRGGSASKVGRLLDGDDFKYYNGTFQASLEQTASGTTSKWISPVTGNSGTVTPTRYYENSKGQYCREFSQNLVIGSVKDEFYGTACREEDGNWVIVNN